MEQEKHLSIEQIEWLIETRPHVSEGPVRSDLLEDARRHLAECEECRRLVSMHSEFNQSLRSIRNERAVETQDCPPSASLRGLMAGILNRDDADKILEHIVQCGHCSATVRRATEDFRPDEMPEEDRLLALLHTTKPDWQESFARKLAALSATRSDLAAASSVKEKTGSLTKYKFRWRFVYAAAAATAALLVVAGLWTLRRFSQRSVDQLLLQAYAEQRTMELRISGAPHAPLRQERGPAHSPLTKPAALLKAEYLIKERLAAKPEDAAALTEKGRAELLEWQYDDAIETLRHALDLNPDLPGLLCDLATAYAQRAESENRPLDYSQAIEYLGRSLSKQPQDPAALFNRAVVEERLSLLEEAKKDWERYLLLDPRGPWSEEATQRLGAIRRRLQKSSSLSPVEIDPAADLAELEARAKRQHGNHEARSDSLDEDYLDVAVKHWLPVLSNQHEHPRQSMEWRALDALSRVLIAGHHDRWLADLLSACCSEQILRGWGELGSAAELNADGNFDAAVLSAEHAYRTLSQQNSRAGAARAVWEQAYALQRGQQGRLCLEVLDRAAAPRTTSNYPWLNAELHLERSICSAMVGRLKDVQAETQEAMTLADSAGYATLQLRGMHIAGMSVAGQDPDRAWSWFQKGLQAHWAGEYRPFRAYQFYAEMSVTPESKGQWHAARTLMEEAVTHISRTPNRLMEAVARQSLAVDADLSGQPEEASEEFRRAHEIFSSLPRSPATQALIFYADVAQAALESQQGRTESALAILVGSRRNASAQSQYWDWLHYYQTLGVALLRRGTTLEAEKALRMAVYISESALSTITSETDRLFWERQSMDGYRSLVELEWEKKHDIREALEMWEWYKSAPIRNQTLKVPNPGIDFTKLQTDEPPPLPSLTSENLAGLTDATVLSFAQLQGRIFVWLFDDRGVYGTKLSVLPEDLDRTVRRFLRLCSDSSSNADEIRRTGRQLYHELIFPLEDHLDAARVLVVESDGILQQVPFAALLTPQGLFLSERYAIVSSPGLDSWRRMRQSGTFSAQDKALVVATSGNGARFGIVLPRLPDSEEEARAVSGWFADHVLLTGNAATLNAVRRELPLVRVFHFAGHAIGGNGRNGLLLARFPAQRDNDSGVTELFDASQLSSLEIRRTDLVVLSACATAAEDGGMASPESLVRVFLYAGVPTVIASRWNVDSHATTALMREFYLRLRMGRKPALALQSAADIVRRNPETAHPYYWAAFGAFGRN